VGVDCLVMNPIFAIGLPHGMEWIWIFLIFVLVFGADKIPKLARGLGKSLGEFKKAKEDFEKELHSAASPSTTPTAPTVTANPTATPISPVLDDKLRVPPAGTETGVSTGSAGSVDELTKKI
jgi:sec-independent protein translocase protein TatA